MRPSRRRVYPEEPPQAASRRAPPQDEDQSLCRTQTILILRSARRARLEGRRTLPREVLPLVAAQEFGVDAVQQRAVAQIAQRRQHRFLPLVDEAGGAVEGGVRRQ